MVAQAYECGVTFFLSRSRLTVWRSRVLTNVVDSIQMKRTFQQMQSLFMQGGQENMAAAPVPGAQAVVRAAGG